MLRTLSCLAGAMTGTASLLAWIDPSLPPSAQTLSQAEMFSLARSVVFDGVRVRPTQWRDVEVVEGPVVRSEGVLLTADVDRSECHFRIDDQGRFSRARLWDRQLPPSDAPHTIRIEIAQTNVRPFPSSAQESSVHALLVALDEASADAWQPGESLR